jgi:ribonuclease P protein component
LKPTQTFRKAERLCSKIVMEKLFKSGRSFTLFPFRVVWLMEGVASSFPVQVAFAVPKKIFKRAVDRNKLKRRAREAYRKTKHGLYELLEKRDKKIALLLIYTAKEKLEYEFIANKINLIIERLLNEISNGPDQ